MSSDSSDALLRVIDFGTRSSLHSQTLWHAIAYGVSEGSQPTLSFVRPSDPYVCIGYHRRLDEVDLEHCRMNGLPVYRRMVGGGTVYLDSGQLFFQITVPIKMVPLSRPKALRWLLEPVVKAFRAGGVDANIDDHLEIVVDDRKICGYGAGQIGEAAVVVGNLIESFDHEAASAIVNAPSEAARAEVSRLMSRYVTATPMDSVVFKSAAVEEYASSLGLRSVPGELSTGEEQRLSELDERFLDPEWVSGPTRPSRPAWQMKVRAGVWVFAAAGDGAELTLGVDNQHILSADIADSELNGKAADLSKSLVGLDLNEAASTLGAAGAPGRRISKLLELAEPARL